MPSPEHRPAMVDTVPPALKQWHRTGGPDQVLDKDKEQNQTEIRGILKGPGKDRVGEQVRFRWWRAYR